MGITLKTEEFEMIVSCLMGYLETPSPELPSTQVFTDRHLRSLLIKSRKNSDCRKSLTGKLLVEHLIKSGLAEKLSTSSENGNYKYPFYYVGTGDTKAIDNLEIIQAFKHQGIICYFSAISYHQLTTQMIPHHHIATLIKVQKKAKIIPDNSSEKKIHKLGTYLFDYEAIPYYWTQRDQKLIPGIQSVYLSDKAIVNVTTLEQTLLDTLHRPWHCGGPAVVFEVWEKGLERINESRLGEYLNSINNPLYNRRVGCMLDLNQHKVTDLNLTGILQKAKESANKPVDNLLPIVPSGDIEKKWNLELPE